MPVIQALSTTSTSPHWQLKISHCQAGYLDEMLQHLNMTDCYGRHIPLDPVLQFSCTDEPKCHAQETILYHEIIDIIGRKATWTSPGLAYAHSYLSCFLVSPAFAHLQAAKDVLHYIKLTRDNRPIYRRVCLLRLPAPSWSFGPLNEA